MRELDASQKTALCSAIRTSRYARKVVTLLRDLSEDLYKTDISNPLQNIDVSMDDDLARVFDELLRDIDKNNPMEAEQVLRSVIDYVKNIEEINFVIPIHPKKEFVERLYGWCADNINKEVLIDFTTNRLMDSGLLMIYKGKYFEYSLENLLNEYLSTHELGRYFDKVVKDEQRDKNLDRAVSAEGQAGQQPISQQAAQQNLEGQNA